MDRGRKILKIHKEVVALKKSPLYKYRTRNKYLPVIGEGSLDASIIFIGEAPGENEAKTGKPFHGRSGKMLDELLTSIKMDRQKVYITNLVNDRPHDNRDPSPKEIALYGTFLERQIEIIKPKVIATLGRHSMKYIFEKFSLNSEIQVISKVHGKTYKILASWGEVIIIALYHPAVALYNGSMKSVLKDDFKVLKRHIK
jgi:DNA polymerase